MRYRTLGNSGLHVSVIGIGTNQFGGKVDADGVERIIQGAIDLGVNFIDTADTFTRAAVRKRRSAGPSKGGVTESL